MPNAISRIYGPALVAAGPATIYTVPATTLTRLRQIHIGNTAAGIVTFTLSIGADAAATRLFPLTSIPAGAAQDYFWDMPMTAGEILTVSSGTPNILTLTISAIINTLG
jgi:hypothetical protein